MDYVTKVAGTLGLNMGKVLSNLVEYRTLPGVLFWETSEDIGKAYLTVHVLAKVARCPYRVGVPKQTLHYIYVGKQTPFFT